VALEAPLAGAVTLLERPCAGKELRVNFRTESGGWLQFELAPGIPNRSGPEAPAPIPGFSFAECDPLQGDALNQPVTWRGRSDLSSLRGSRVVLRVRMMRAKLFATAL
jgi:hypothetical protein